MICKNCGFENPVDADFCKKCGVSFFEVIFKPYWYTVFAGFVIGILALHVLYAVLGTKHVFTIGMLPIIFISCCATYMLAYNRNIQETYFQCCNKCRINRDLSGNISFTLTPEHSITE